MIQRSIYLSLLFLLHQASSAQFFDDFSQIGLEKWSGDTADFHINANEELQLMAETGGDSWIYTMTQIPDSAIWELYIRLEFPPSGSNQLSWVLQSNSSNSNNLNGYGLRLGESGSSDALEFVRYDMGTPTLLGRMQEGAVANDPVELTARIERRGVDFTLLVAYDKSAVFTDTLRISDDSYSFGPSLFTGLLCNYTSTRTDKFFFDDYLIGRLSPDKDPPIVQGFRVEENRALVQFNERIDHSNASYDIRPGSFQISDSLSGNSALLIINVDPGFTSLTNYELVINGIKDEAGNPGKEIVLDIQYIKSREPRPFEIVINEIMAAPNDQTSLPAIEYLELYNRSSHHLSLANLFLVDNSSITELPSYILPPGQHLIICADSDSALLSVYGRVLGVENLISLNNGGDFIQLKKNNGEFIHGVDYKDTWYKDPQKDDGGWSLELIHPDLACSREAAFFASESPIGGSPGQENSVFDPEYSDPFQLTQAGLLDNDIVKLSFNQWLAEVDSSETASFSFQPDINIHSSSLSMEAPNILEIQLARELEEGILYQIEIGADLENCKGEPTGQIIETSLGVPAVPDSGDILISEIMFDPISGESQWIEVFNASDKIFEFRYLVLKTMDAEGESQSIIGHDNQLLSGQYFVLSESKESLITNYKAPFPQRILLLDLPSLDRTEAALELSYIFGIEAKLLDRVCYNKDWHSGFLREDKGVSLERLRFDMPACAAGNWQSAAEEAHFGTPTGVNSQSIALLPSLNSGFSLLSPTFSPDGDSFEDFAVIHYKQPDDGNPPPQLNLNIYNPNGSLVNALYSNFSLSAQSQLLWDGRMNNGILAPEGFYLLQAETFNEKGERSRWQGTIYLTYPE